MAAIEICNLTKTFGRTKALDDVSVTIQRGEMVALIGASGSGKSTLIRHIAGLVPSDPGVRCKVVALGQTVQQSGRLAPDVRAQRARIGVIFQQFNLVGRLSLLKNVVIGALGHIPTWRGTLGLFTRQEKLSAMAALQRVGIAQHAAQRASTLSGGQQQRAAIARALVQRAEIILADEPIASLDPASAKRVMENLAHVHRTDGITVVVCLHQVEYATRYCPRTIAMRDGRVIFDGPSAALTRDMLHNLYGADSEELILPERLTGSKAVQERERARFLAVAS